MLRPLNNITKVLHTAGQSERATELFHDLTEKFDPDHINYIAGRGLILWDLIPAKLEGPVTLWMIQNLDLKNMSAEAWRKAIYAARPDCNHIFDTPTGSAWLTKIIKELRS